MRNSFLIIPALILMLSGCNTASNMAHEVGGWFNTKRGEPIAHPLKTPSEQPALTVTQEPLNTLTPPTHPSAVKVALLLPLSGKHAGLGKQFQDAAQLAVNDLSADNFELIPKDTHMGAAAAAQSALRDGAQIIIGPLFSEKATEVKNTLAGALPILTLSNDARLAGNNTYVLGFNPTQQVTRALEYAKNKGIRSFAILAPASSYGDIAIAAAQSSDIQIVETQRYANTKDSIKKAVAAISARRGEIQGILLPDGGQALGHVAAELTAVALSAHDIPIIGTGLWDDQNAQQYPVLVGGFYAAPDPAARSNFITRFQKAYSMQPVRLATLAYDATALVAVLAKNGQGFDQAALTNPNGFAGMDGIFRLSQDGIAERGLAILEVTASGARVVDSAPQKF